MSNKPFDLEKAFNGEPVLFLNNKPPLKAYISKSTLRPDAVIIEFEDKNRAVIRRSKKYLMKYGTNLVMYEEPRPRVTLDLPCPLKEPQEGMWFITESGEAVKSNYRYDYTDALNLEGFASGLYFATKEDAQEWLDAMRNARR